MNDNPDRLTGGGDGEQRAIDQLKQAIRTVIAARNAASLKNEVKSIKSQAESAKDRLDDRGDDQETGRDPRALEKPIEGKVGDETSLKHQVKISQIYVQEAIKAYKTDPGLIPIATGSFSARVINKLADSIQNPDSEITPQSAPYIYFVLEKAIDGGINSVDDLAQIFQNIKYLKIYNQTLYQRVRQGFIDLAKERGLSESEAIQSFKEEESLLSKQKKLLQEQGSNLTPKMIDRYQELNKRISDALVDNDQLPNGHANKLQPDERLAFTLFRVTGKSENEEALARAIRKLGGITENDLIEFVQIHEAIFQNPDPRNLKMFINDKDLTNMIDRAVQDFTPEGLEDKGIISRTAQGDKIFDKRKFKKLIAEYHYKPLERIHANRSQTYEQAIQIYGQQYPYYFSAIQGLVSSLCTNFRETFRGDEEMREFFRDVGSRYLGSIINYAQTFHNLPLYARDASSFEKWPQFLGYLFPSELAEIFDPDDKLMEITRREISQYLRRRLILNGNLIPSNLYSGEYSDEGVRYSIKDYDEIKKEVKQIMTSLGKEYDDWEYERAMTYAVGIGIASLIDPEIIASADPNIPAKFEGIYPLAAVIAAKHNWGLGRGWPASGLYPDLLAMKIPLFPEDRGLVSRTLTRKRWWPKFFHDFAVGKVEQYGEKVFDALLNRDASYQELLSMVNIGSSLLSRGGWRVSPLKGYLKEYLKEGKYDGINLNLDKAIWKDEGWTSDNWQKYFDLSMGLYGTTSLWWSAGEKADTELKRFLAIRLNKETVSDFEFAEYFKKEEALKKEIEIEVDGKERKYSFGELRIMRNYMVRGEIFFRYLKRNPGEFVSILAQVAPQLMDGKINYFSTEEQLRSQLRAEGKSKLQIEKELATRQAIFDRWGLENFETLGKVWKWLFDTGLTGGLANKYASEIGEGKKFKDNKELVKYFMKQSAIGLENVLKDKEADGKDKPGRNRLYMQKKDIPDAILADAMWEGDNALMKIFKDENFGGFDDKKNFNYGDFGFFYRTGELWTHKNGDVNPFATDMNYFAVYQNIGKVGEDVTKRYLGDAENVRKVIEGVGQLDGLLRHAALNQDLKEIYELHDKLFITLKGIISEEYAQKANYILASIVAKFFHEHSDMRQPFFGFPFNIPVKWILGKNISLSKIVTGNINAYSWDTNGVKDYFRKLAYEYHAIAEEGMWSAKQLDLGFEAETTSFVLGEAIPSFMFFLLAYLVWRYAQKALEESQGKKQ